jgi:hypothetical protein
VFIPPVHRSKDRHTIEAAFEIRHPKISPPHHPLTIEGGATLAVRFKKAVNKVCEEDYVDAEFYFA